MTAALRVPTGPNDRIPVTVLGATGVVGQRFVAHLAEHPWFRIEHLCASARSAGQRYADACTWHLDSPAYAGLGDATVEPCDPDAACSPLVFSALDAAPAREIEPRYARAGAHVFSNASAFRAEPDVPLLVPEVNPEHLALLPRQRRERGWSGSILTNPNCTTTVLVMALAPLQRAFGIEALSVVSQQAISGAGYPGVASLDILGNVVPFIGGEEDKVLTETRTLLGDIDGETVREAELAVAATCTRVPVIDGHSEAVSVRLRGDVSPDEARAAFEEWTPLPEQLGLPSAPPVALRVHDERDRPQVRRDVARDGGMSVHVGRIRRDAVLGLSFFLVGHNTERGAAGGSLLNAELALMQGVL